MLANADQILGRRHLENEPDFNPQILTFGAFTYSNECGSVVVSYCLFLNTYTRTDLPLLPLLKKIILKRDLLLSLIHI